jgi:3-oxoacyl-[acyl-carrier-protein] synthase III
MDQLIDGTGERGSAFVKRTLAKQGWTPQDLRWLIGDNVAAIIPIDMAAVLGVPEDRILLENCTRYGHAWVADMFVNLATILDEHPPAHGDRLACVGIGQGEHWGVALLEAHMEDA